MNKTLQPSRRRGIALWGPVLLAAAIVLLAFATGVLDKQRVFVNMAHTDMVFENEKRMMSMADGDHYGVLPGIGPYYELPTGTYRLQWQVDGDGENKLRLSSTNGAAMQPNEIALPAGQLSGEFEFTVFEAVKNLQIDVEFCAGTYMELLTLRMYSPFYKDRAWTLLFFAAGLSACWVLWHREKIDRRTLADGLLIGVAVLIASSPMLKDALNLGHDTYFHMARVENLVSGLCVGNFPVRAGGYTYNGYGAITSVFYPDIFLYPLALMRLGGASPTYVMNVYAVAVNAVTAVCMYVGAKRMFLNRWAGLFSTILYTLAVYRISDVTTRYAMGEMTAMAFLPLFLLGLWEVVLGDKQRYATLGVGAACIFLCHMLTTLLCAATAFAFCVLYALKIVREKRLVPLFQAMSVALLLCAFQIAPFLTYSAQGIGAQGLKTNMAANAIAPAQLFSLGTGEVAPCADAQILYFSVEIGLPLIACAAMGIYKFISAEEWSDCDRLAGLMIVAGSGCALMSTTLFPWEKFSILTNHLIGYIQFPWRFLMMTTLFFALAGGYGVARIMEGRGEQMALMLLCVSALAALPTLSSEIRTDEFIRFGEGGDPDLFALEYTIPGTVIKWPVDRDVAVNGDVSVERFEKKGTCVTAEISSETDAMLIFPMFGYDGYAAEVDGQPMAVGLGENNRLTVQLPAGTSGILRVWFMGKSYWRIFDAISLITWLWLARRRAKYTAREKIRC